MATADLDAEPPRIAWQLRYKERAARCEDVRLCASGWWCQFIEAKSEHSGRASKSENDPETDVRSLGTGLFWNRPSQQKTPDDAGVSCQVQSERTWGLGRHHPGD